MFQAIATVYLINGAMLTASGFGRSPGAAYAAARAAGNLRAESVKPGRVRRITVEGC